LNLNGFGSFRMAVFFPIIPPVMIFWFYRSDVIPGTLTAGRHDDEQQNEIND